LISNTPRTLTIRVRPKTRTTRNRQIWIHKILEKQTAIPEAATSSVEVVVLAGDAEAVLNKAKDRFTFKIVTLVHCLAIHGVNVEQTSLQMTRKATVLCWAIMPHNLVVVLTGIYIPTSLAQIQTIHRLLSLSKILNRSPLQLN
jgi:hypothetical protein